MHLVVKSEQNVGLVAVLKALTGVGHWKSKDAFCVPGKVQETCSSEMFGGQGADFLRAFRFAKIILRDRCSTSHDLDLASLFMASAVL